ncbi:hypothetical protein KAT84_02635 [Candidatus Bipolaricaulota bacterium]|nr:hypothetical protein [Candidatus Bipolaricaulota bacterium]
MRAIQVILAIAVLSCGAAYADSMEGQGTASGNVVLWFSGTSATATFEGTFALTGQLLLADAVIPFSASGWTRGSGGGDTATMDIEAWATFAATGLTEAGEQIVVQGGLTLSGLSADASGSSGEGTGAFFATIFIGAQQYHVQGDAAGSAAGAFVIPKDPLSMEMTGDGIFDLSGEMTLVSPMPQVEDSPSADNPDSERPEDSSVAELLPWDTDTWPEELLAELLDILTAIVEIQIPDEDGSANE